RRVPMSTEITPLLMFDGKAEEAINFYVSLFENSSVGEVRRYGPHGPGAEGAVMHASFSLAGRPYMAVDSSTRNDFAFTPATSQFVRCEDEAEIERLFGALTEGGNVFMPLGNYGFSKRFGWGADRFGVSWQLMLPN